MGYRHQDNRIGKDCQYSASLHARSKAPPKRSLDGPPFRVGMDAKSGLPAEVTFGILPGSFSLSYGVAPGHYAKSGKDFHGQNRTLHLRSWLRHPEARFLNQKKRDMRESHDQFEDATRRACAFRGRFVDRRLRADYTQWRRVHEHWVVQH